MQKKSLGWMSHDVEDLESYIKTGHEEISRVIELVLNNEDTSDAHHRKYVPELTLEEIYDVFENVAFKKILNKKTMLEFDKCTNPGDGNTRVYSKLINFVNPETNYE